MKGLVPGIVSSNVSGQYSCDSVQHEARVKRNQKQVPISKFDFNFLTQVLIKLQEKTIKSEIIFYICRAQIKLLKVQS